MKVRMVVTIASILLATSAWAQWTIHTVDDAGGSNGKKIITDEAGNPHIFYRGGGYARYAVWTGTDWQIDSAMKCGGSPVLGDIDSDGRPHIVASYMNPGLTYYLQYAVKSSGTWDVDTIVSLSYSVDPQGLLVDDSNVPHVFALYTGSTKPLYHYWKLGSNWQSEVLLDSVNCSSVAMDDSGRIYVAFKKNNRLSLLYKNGSRQITMLVDSVVGVGQYPSVALKPDGTVCISYYDATNRDLKYAEGVPTEEGLLLRRGTGRGEE
jgi:hypothetical protein